MPNVCLSDEIMEFISWEDFDRLVSEPNLSENDVKFHEAPSLRKLLREFGY